MPLVPAAPRGLLLIECRNRRDRGNVLLAAAMAIFSLHCLLVCPHGSSLLARRFVGFRRIISGIISRRWSAGSWDGLSSLCFFRSARTSATNVVSCTATLEVATNYTRWSRGTDCLSRRPAPSSAVCLRVAPQISSRTSIGMPWHAALSQTLRLRRYIQA